MWNGYASRMNQVDVLKAYGLRMEYVFVSGTDIKCTWNTHRLRIGRRDAMKTKVYI